MSTAKKIYLAGAVRTPIGRYGGALAGLTPAELGNVVARESLRRAGIAPNEVQEVVWGCARQAGAGPNVGRQIAYRAGVPETVPASTINQACGSGLKAIVLAAQEIMLGRARVVLAGGVESMSRVPYFAEGARWPTAQHSRIYWYVVGKMDEWDLNDPKAEARLRIIPTRCLILPRKWSSTER